MNHAELADLVRHPATLAGIPSLMDYHSLYRRIADEAPDGSLVVEVGSYLGAGVCHLAAYAREAGKKLRIVAVDHCKGSDPATDGTGYALARALGGSFATILHRNVVAVGADDMVSILVADSTAAAGLFADGSCFAVFLDGAHDRPSVAADIRAWRRKVMMPGGILAGHDISHPAFVGVREAVAEVLGDGWAVDPDSPSCWSARP